MPGHISIKKGLPWSEDFSIIYNFEKELTKSQANY